MWLWFLIGVAAALSVANLAYAVGTLFGSTARRRMPLNERLAVLGLSLTSVGLVVWAVLRALG